MGNAHTKKKPGFDEALVDELAKRWTSEDEDLDALMRRLDEQDFRKRVSMLKPFLQALGTDIQLSIAVGLESNHDDVDLDRNMQTGRVGEVEKLGDTVALHPRGHIVHLEDMREERR